METTACQDTVTGLPIRGSQKSMTLCLIKPTAQISWIKNLAIWQWTFILLTSQALVFAGSYFREGDIIDSNYVIVLYENVETG